MIGTLNQRQGILTDTFDEDGFVRIEDDVRWRKCSDIRPLFVLRPG